MNKMKKWLFCFSFAALCFQVSFALSADIERHWKTSGEYLESLYLTSLLEGLNETQYLSQAYQIYQLQANAGDKDAQFRIGALSSAPVDNSLACKSYSNLLLTSPMPSLEVVRQVEIFAVLGNGECQTALGQWFKEGSSRNEVRSFYWLQRAALTSSLQGLGGSPLFRLGLALEDKLGFDNKSVVSVMTRAAELGSSDASDWLQWHDGINGRIAYAFFLRGDAKSNLADQVIKGLGSRNFTELWRQDDLCKNVGSKLQRNLHRQNVESALVAANGRPQWFAMEAIREIANVLERDQSLRVSLRHHLMDTLVFILESGPMFDPNPEVLNHLVQFLQSSFAKHLNVGKKLRLLKGALIGMDKVALSEFNKKESLAGLASSILKDAIQSNVGLRESLNRIQLGLELRRILLLSEDVGPLDAVINSVLHRFWERFGKKPEAILKIVFELSKQNGLPDLLLLNFKPLFANELSQLEINMRLEDLLSGLNSGHASRSLESVKTLAGLQDEEITFESASGKALYEYPKLDELRNAGLCFKNLYSNLDTNLFAESILELNRYQSAFRNYQASGTFFGDSSLSATLSTKHIEAVKGGFDSRLRKLSDIAHEFGRNRESKENLADSKVAKKISDQTLEVQLSIKNHELKIYLTELISTQSALDAQLNYGARFGAAKASLLTSKGLKVFQHVPGESDSFTVCPQDAKLSATFLKADDSPWYSHRSVELDKNAILNIKVSGEWSPTCALRRAEIGKDLGSVTTGPEGFRLQLANGESLSIGNDARKTFSTSKEESETSGGGVDWIKAGAIVIGAVAGFVVGGPGGSAAAGTVAAGLVGASIGATLSMPFSYSTGSQKTNGTSSSDGNSEFSQNSKFSSNTASFQSGLRLKHTPYPAAPAGAYLAVLVSREQKNLGQVVGITIVQAQTSIVAPQNVEVYFIVNDCSDGGSREGSLTVNLQKLQPASVEAERLIDAMESGLKAFARKGELLAQEGGELSSRIETLKAEVIADLKRDTIVDFMAEPTLRSVFMQWLHNEADKITRKVRVMELSRSIFLVGLEIESLKKQLEMNTKHEQALDSRMNRLVTHSKQIPVFDSVNEVIKHATKYLVPLFQLYYPNAARMNFVETQTFDIENMAKQVEQVSTKMIQGLEKEWIASTTEEYVVLRIPRPGLILGEEQRRIVPILSDERAKMFWDHLFVRDFGTKTWGLRLGFEDLYQDVTQARLLPTQETPIIIDMALLFGTDDPFAAEHLQTQFLASTIDMVVDREQVFPQRSGPRKFVLNNDDLRNHKISIGFANTQELVTDAVRHIRNDISMNLNTAKGLSPFSAFSFGQHSQGALKGLETALGMDVDGYPKNLNSIFIVMKVVSTNRFESMNWMKY